MIEADNGKASLAWHDVDIIVAKLPTERNHIALDDEPKVVGADQSDQKSLSATSSSSHPTVGGDSDGARKLAVLLPKGGLFFSQYATVKIDAVQKLTSSDVRLGTLTELQFLIQGQQWPQVKKFLRENNWPSGHPIREELWKTICRDSGTDAQMLLYREIVEAFKGRCSVTPVFLSAPGVVLSDHQLNESGRQTLIKLLTAVEHARPDFTYVPILYPLCAMFLHYMSDENAFACVMSLFSQSQKFLMQTDISVAACKRTLVILLKKHARKVYSLMMELLNAPGDANLIRVCSHWSRWIFCALPFDHLVRVMDCFLFEGQKVLYRVAIAILILWHRENAKKLEAVTGWSDVILVKDICDFTQSIKCTPQKFLKVAFNLRNVKMSYIRRVQEENELRLRMANSTLAEVASTQNLKSLLAEHHYFSVAMPSQILAAHLISLLISWIPTRYHLVTPQKLFSVIEDGRSFTTLWSKIEDFYPTVLLIQTTWKQIFGAFCSEAWEMRKRLSKLSYFGTGESFLFQFTPKAICYSWVGLQKSVVSHGEELFQCADATTLIVGGGGNEGLSIRQTLERGSTNHCDTFDNPPLVPEKDFEIEAFEVFGFIHDNQ